MSRTNDLEENLPKRLVRLIGSFGFRPLHYVVLLLVHAQLFSSGRGAGDTDWYDFIYPWADALRLTILKYHQFPWWNPWSMSGQPFFAEPQTAVLTPDTLFIVFFGAVVGYKLVILFYTVVGYEGSRFLCRQLFGRSRFVEGASLIPALLPPMALHLGVGHPVLLVFWLFPWLLGLALSWQRSRRHALALGLVVGYHFLTYVHYSLIIGFTIVAVIVAWQLLRTPPTRDTAIKGALVICAALGLGLTRIALTVSFVSRFPRTETLHYPIVASLSEIVPTLIEPLQTQGTPAHIAGLGWWELGSYVGLLALLLAYEGFRRGDRRLRPLHLGALLCLLLAWNNRDKFLPGYWMHVIPPWKTMVVITRWRLYACYLILVGAVQGLLVLRESGRARLAVALAALVVGDLGFHIIYAYQGTFERVAPPVEPTPDPPRTVFDQPTEVWKHLRMNLVSMGSEFPLLGWRDHYPRRDHLGSPGYRGDYTGTRPVHVESWSPNRVVLQATPGDTLTINVNPSSYWRLGEEQLFPRFRAMEPDQPFHLIVPPSGRMELTARPPHWAIWLLLQGLFAVLAAMLFLNYSRGPNVRPEGGGVGKLGNLAS